MFWCWRCSGVGTDGSCSGAAGVDGLGGGEPAFAPREQRDRGARTQHHRRRHGQKDLVGDVGVGVFELSNLNKW